jgi:hypothetical protein
VIGGKGNLGKVVMKVSNSIAKAETTNLPVTTNAMATNAAFRSVRLIVAVLLPATFHARAGEAGFGADL